MEGKVCVLVMGVSGCGKSSVASALQAKVGEGVTFLDADAFHPPENVAKMKNGMLKNLFSVAGIQSQSNLRASFTSLPRHSPDR
jgi:uridine kinase